MNKNKKFLMLFLALAMMCLCLTGCDDLDNLREQHAFWTVDGDTTSITYKGAVYKELPELNDLDPLYNSAYDEFISVTNSDVPVLLSTTYGVSLNISADERFITGFIYNDYEAEYKDASSLFSSIQFYPESEDGRYAIYCKEDIYDEVCNSIKDGIKFTNYGYSYYTYDDRSYMDTYRYYYLSDEECDAVNEVVKTVKPQQTSDSPYMDIYICALDKITEDKMFGEVSYEIYRDGYGNYSLEHYSYVTEEYKSYVVPEKYNDIFDKIVEKAESQNEEYY